MDYLKSSCMPWPERIKSNPVTPPHDIEAWFAENDTFYCPALRVRMSRKHCERNKKKSREWHRFLASRMKAVTTFNVQRMPRTPEWYRDVIQPGPISCLRCNK